MQAGMGDDHLFIMRCKKKQARDRRSAPSRSRPAVVLISGAARRTGYNAAMANAWRSKGLGEGAFAALAQEMAASELWSLLHAVLERRAAAREPAALLRQWEQDEFTAPAPLDQRAIVRMDGRLLEAAAAFEALELSPLAPLGSCAAMGFASQNKIVSALRGTEVSADPTNAMALEIAARLRRTPGAVPRLATCQRVVRAQRLPPRAQRSGVMRHFGQHFRLFALATGGREAKDHALTVEALAEQIRVHLDAMDLLARDCFRFPEAELRLFATAPRAPLLARIEAALGPRLPVRREALEHPYYSGGLRFQIWVRSDLGEVPLSDGGTFDWLGKLSANQRNVFVASGMGSQLVLALLGPT